jgi:hypothetical protein
MNIHQLYQRVSPHFRRRRMRAFFDHLQPDPSSHSLLDIGGYPYNWTGYPPCAKRLEVFNLDRFDLPADFASRYHASAAQGDACQLGYADGEFDIVFSNSVIEHVGTWDRQVAFASEARRVGRALWVQTPAREFFIEPHYLAPFIHWLPAGTRRHLARWFTPWGWLTKPSRQQVEARLKEIRLISFQEMKSLFPDCQILREKFLGLLTKSYIAVRLPPGS